MEGRSLSRKAFARLSLCYFSWALCQTFEPGCTCGQQTSYKWDSNFAYIKLPSLDVFASLLTGYDDYELRDLAARHPLIKLGHYFLNVGLDLIVRGDYPQHEH